MIPEIRSGVLLADVGYSEDDEEEEETEEKGIKEVFISYSSSLPKFPYPKIIYQLEILYSTTKV